MKRFPLLLVGLAVAACFFPGASAHGATRHAWRLQSPDHEQTFVFGTETNRVWTQWGRDRHLALLLNYTNDPYVDSDNPRRYDNFRFDFPQVRLGKDGRTFYHQTPDGRLIPVAQKRPNFFGIDEVRLLPNADVVIDLPHGYITVSIILEEG